MHATAHRLIAICVLGLAASAAGAATTAGVYAILDKVELEPAEHMPDRVRLSGVFVVPQPISSGLHLPPVRGHLYFSLNPDQPEASRADWQALRAAAGSGEVVGFAEYWVQVRDQHSLDRRPAGLRGTANVNTSLVVDVHEDGAPALPVPYPVANGRGVVTSFDRDTDICPRFGRSTSDIIADLREAHAPGEPHAPLPVCPQRVGLIDAMRLDSAFLEQQREEDWAAHAEGLVIASIAEARPELTHFAVECRETICHASFVFPSREYQKETGERLVIAALGDVPGFAPGTKVNPSFGEVPQLDTWIQRRRPE